jgi:hypothetical protein
MLQTGLADSKIHGRGVFAAKDYYIGEKVFDISMSNCLQLLNSTNHSCDPNCRVTNDSLYVIRYVRAHEEITIDYRNLGFTIKPEEFDCRCGAPNCIKHIKV